MPEIHALSGLYMAAVNALTAYHSAVSQILAARALAEGCPLPHAPDALESEPVGAKDLDAVSGY